MNDFMVYFISFSNYIYISMFNEILLPKHAQVFEALKKIGFESLKCLLA